MPTYEYKCLQCGVCFEQFQSMNDAPLSQCRECRGAVKRLIGSGAGIIFKGSGFYCTDYRNKTTPETSSSDSSSDSSKSDSSKSDSKSSSGSESAAKPAAATTANSSNSKS